MTELPKWSRELDLVPNPEGGWFKEMWRSVALTAVTSASRQLGDFIVFGRHKSNDDRTARQR
jgi:predicted cupin superfamily sugar epimerase